MGKKLNILYSILGINKRNLEYIYELNPRSAFPLVDNKVKTKEVLQKAQIPFPATIVVLKNFYEIEKQIYLLKNTPAFVIKPARGRAGGGIMLIKTDENGLFRSVSGREITGKALKKHCGDILFGVFSFGRLDDFILIEERVEQCSLLNRIYSRGISDIRVIIYKDIPIMAMLRVPTHSSDGKANLHQGAIGVKIDMNTGLTGDGVWKKEHISFHPDSKAGLKGIQIPFWDQILGYSQKASAAIPLKYTGIDFVIDKDRGPLVLELNARPGLQIQVINNQGLLDALRGEAGEKQ